MGGKPRKPKLEVTLRFETKEHMDFIMGQLTDGFGENEANFLPTQDPNYYVVGIFETELWLHHKGLRDRINARLSGVRSVKL